MNKLKLLEQLQTIKYKLDNNIELTNNDYKLFSLILFGLGVGIMEHFTNILINKIGDKRK